MAKFETMRNSRILSWDFHRFVVLIFIIGLMVWRAPNLLIAPRFWAEEGVFYFKYAFEHSFWQSLRYVWWDCGYLNLIANIAVAFAAHVIRLEYAPFVTTYAALLIQLIPFLIVLFGDSTLVDSPARKGLACCIFLFAPSFSSEVWLNTINSQIYFGLAAILILVEELGHASRLKKWAYRFLLAIGGLSGVYVSFLLPAFLLKAFIEKSKERYVHLVIVGATMIVQLSIFFSAVFLKKLGADRTAVPGMHAFMDILFFHTGVPLFGRGFADMIVNYLGVVGNYLFLTVFLAILAPVFFKGKSAQVSVRSSQALLAVSLIVILFVTSMTARGGRLADERYSVLTGILVLLIVLNTLRTVRQPFVSALLLVLVLVSLSSGVLAFRSGRWLVCDGAFPHTWQQEIELWRDNPNHMLRICPDSVVSGVTFGWNIKLNPHARPEHGPRTDPAPGNGTSL